MTDSAGHTFPPRTESRHTNQNGTPPPAVGQKQKQPAPGASLKKKRRQDAVRRRMAVFHAEQSWDSGMRVYDESSFERLRMPRSPQWAVVWSDLMMTMFIFFAVLYIYQSDNREFVFREVPVPGPNIGSAPATGAPDEEPMDNRLEKIFDLSRQALDTDTMREFARVDLAPDKTVRIILTGDLLFASGSAELKGTALQGLRKIIPLVAQTPYMINVVGHTDNIPIHTPEFPSNWELSLVRASRVAHFLMQETRLAENRFYVTGHGAQQSVAANDTPENRAANRRVEIILTREKPSAGLSGGNNEE